MNVRVVHHHYQGEVHLPRDSTPTRDRDDATLSSCCSLTFTPCKYKDTYIYVYDIYINGSSDVYVSYLQSYIVDGRMEGQASHYFPDRERLVLRLRLFRDRRSMR